MVNLNIHSDFQCGYSGKIFSSLKNCCQPWVCWYFLQFSSHSVCVFSLMIIILSMVECIFCSLKMTMMSEIWARKNGHFLERTVIHCWCLSQSIMELSLIHKCVFLWLPSSLSFPLCRWQAFIIFSLLKKLLTDFLDHLHKLCNKIGRVNFWEDFGVSTRHIRNQYHRLTRMNKNLKTLFLEEKHVHEILICFTRDQNGSHSEQISFDKRNRKFQRHEEIVNETNVFKCVFFLDFPSFV